MLLVCQCWLITDFWKNQRITIILCRGFYVKRTTRELASMTKLIRLVLRNIGVFCLLWLPLPTQAQSLEVLDAQQQVLAKFTWDGERLKVKDAAGETLLKAKPRDGGGRKYKDRHGAVVAKVKGDDDAFKLKTERGGLLWKVKYQGDKIKMSASEDNALPEELRRKGPDKWALERDDQAYGKVKYYPKKRRTKVKDAQGNTRYQIDNENFSPMAGVLLIPGLQREEAYILMAEIWLRRW